MSTEGVSNTGTLFDSANTGGSSEASKDTNESTKDNDMLDLQDFLQILTAQFKNQNPMDPMSDTEFIGQMAQFNTMEQVNSIRQDIGDIKEDMLDELAQVNEGVNELVEAFNSSSFASASGLQALNLVGKNVKAEIDGETIEGTIESVKNFTEKPVLNVSGNEIELENIVEVMAQ